MLFSDFLSRNSVAASGLLPLIHSTRAYHLRDFVKTNTLLATECDVFRGENLNYFFVGRPAYKYLSEEGEGAYWEYPCCFVFDYTAIGDIKRVFPFDSGAFHRKLYPSYTRMMDKSAFDVGSVPEAPAKIIGAFFGSPSRYFRLNPKPEEDFIREYSLSVMDAELKALHRLALERSATKFDDRRFTVEVQSASSIDLQTNTPLAVIAPSEYFDDKDFRDHVTDIWRAEPISYPIFSLSIVNCYGQIYERVKDFYVRQKLLP